MNIQNSNDLEFSLTFNEEKSSLDVLLELIQKKKKDIKDINIKELTDQFLEYVENMKEKVALEIYSDYANMSAYLIELKTRSLLPNYEANSSKYQRTLEEEREVFIRRLLEHQMYKNAIPLLEDYKKRRELHFDKTNEDFDEYLPANTPMGKLPKKLNINKLKEIFESVLNKQEIHKQLQQPLDLHISNHEYSVSEVVYDFINYMSLHSQTTLSNYFNDLDFSKKNIDYYCMLFFVFLSLIHQENLEINESNGDLNVSLNSKLLDENQQVDVHFIENIKKDLLGE